MLPAAPDWLKLRDGTIEAGVMSAAYVALSGKPQYRLDVRPARGKFACVVTRTHNGKPIDDASAEYATADAALAGGLTRLKEKLGW